jgi:glycosyltransferase involved in cell wall biosynthesis
LRVLHLISGGDTGGAKTHVLSLVRSLSRSIPVRLVCLVEGPFLEEARALGLDILLLRQRRRYDLSVLGGLADLVKTDRMDIVHAHGARANFLVALTKRRLGIPCLTTVHSDYRLDFAGNLYKNLVYTTLNSLALRRFDYYAAVSENFREMLCRRGFPPERIFTVYNGLDFNAVSTFPPREAVLAGSGLTVDPGAPLIGCVGRLAPVKDYPTLLRAAAIVWKARPDARFLIVGGGGELARLTRLADSLGARGRVVFLGHRADPGPLMSVFDINVLTSVSESFPYALLEGARLRLPTISSDVGGVRDLIPDQSKGLLFKSGDHHGLAACLEAMLADPDGRKRMGANLYAFAKENFSLDTMAARHLAIYQRILEGSGEIAHA